MRSLARLLSSTVLLSALLVPSTGKTDAAHSWCVPGGPKSSPSNSGDPNTDTVVNYVCNHYPNSNCCQSNGRWSLWCAQKGAEYAKSQKLGVPDGDICGRYAWTEGPVSSSIPQYYPRDFNIVTLAGDLWNFQDVWGPVAVNGNLGSANGFELNSGSRGLPVAAFVEGSLSLTSGTIFGNLYYGDKKSKIPPTVTMHGSSFNSAPITSSTFTAMSNSLTNMSNALGAYPATPSSRPNQSVVFNCPSQGCDPELNVFSVTADQAKNATSFDFTNVPPDSAVIVNIAGTTPSIANAGFIPTNDVPPYGKILWNFPQATALHIASVALPGSVLAPGADASFPSGQINGTAVVKSASPAWIEFHWYPFHGLAPTGCLEWDGSWSCSRDTYLDDTGNVVFPAPEAGFLEIPGEAYQFKDSMGTGTTYTRTSPTHRMWYSFQPANATPESKPLAVFFNGGPGGATASGLFSFNTGPWTLDPDKTGGKEVEVNSSNWAQFANLLYLDAPATGFSYPMPSSVVGSPSVGLDIYRDSGIMLQVIVQFLKRHPTVRCNPVMLVGESFGGTRAAMMLDHVFNYQSLTSDPIYQDQALFTDLSDQFSNCSAQGTSQFGRQVLIEPVVAGKYQQILDFNPSDATGCVQNADDYQCNQGDGPNDPNFSQNAWYWEKIKTAATNLTHLSTLHTAIGVSPTSIAWFYKDARVGAYGRGNAQFSIPTTTEMNDTFGSLPQADSYFVAMNLDAQSSYPDGNNHFAATYSDPIFGASFLYAVCDHNVKTFITHADHDKAVNVMAIQRAFVDPNSPYPVLVSSCTTDNNYPNSSRPGMMRITCRDSGTSVPIRFPEYSDAGHSVSQRMPVPFLQDVMQWMKD